MADNQFFPGMRVYAPRPTAPDFVKADFIIDIGELLQAQNSGQIRGQIKESRGGKLYAAINDWQPDQQQERPANTQPAFQQPNQAPTEPTVKDTDEKPKDQIPF